MFLVSVLMTKLITFIFVNIMSNITIYIIIIFYEVNSKIIKQPWWKFLI